MKELLWFSHVYAGGEDGHALRDFNLTIFCGEMLCLYGLHGSGKRVVRDILLGRRRMDSGNFFYEEKPVRRSWTFAAKNGVEILDTKLRLIQNFTVYENVFALRERKNPLSLFSAKAAQSETQRMLEAYDMGALAQKRAYELTPFEQQVVLLLKAKISKTRLILFDYVTYNYTKEQWAVLLRLIEEYKHRGVSFLFFCRQETPVMQYADRSVYIENGTDSFIYRAGASVFRREDRQHWNESARCERPLKAIGIAANAEEFWSAPQSFHGLTVELDNIIDRLRPGRNALFVQEGTENAAVDVLDIGNNLCIGMYRKTSACGVVREERVRNVAERFYQECDVRPEKRDPWQLSSFERKLLMLFRCQMQRPEYLVLENPFLNVGDENRPRLLALLRRMTEREIRLLIFTESLTPDELRRMCETVIVKKPTEEETDEKPL